MALALRAAGSVVSSAGGSPSTLTVVVPNTAVVGDFLLLGVVVNATFGGSTIGGGAAPTGWTAGPVVESGDSFTTVFTYYKVCAAPDLGANVSPGAYTDANSCSATGAVCAYSGTASSAPVASTSTGSTGAGSGTPGSATVAAGTVTVGSNEAVIETMGAGWGSAQATLTVPATSDLNYSSNSGSHLPALAFSHQSPAPGSFVTPTFSSVATTNMRAVAFVVTLATNSLCMIL